MNSDFSGINKVEFNINSFEYERTQNWDAFCELNSKDALTFAGDNANQLNSIAWTMFENTDNQDFLGSALLIAEKAAHWMVQDAQAA